MNQQQTKLTKGSDKKTDNKSIADKIYLRKEGTKDISQLRILDLFAGNNVLWRDFEKEKYFGVEIQKNKGINLCANSRRIIDTVDFSQFNVIDCDSFGIAFDIYKKLLESESVQKGTVIFYTAIVNAFTQMHREGINMFGIKNMFQKCSTLFNPKGIEFFYGMLGNYGVEKVFYYEIKDHYLKHYGFFII